MRLDEHDAAYLWDMLETARTVQDLVSGVSQDQYTRERKLQLAVERAVEIIGQAAWSVSTAFQEAHPEIPWRGVRSGLLSVHWSGGTADTRIPVPSDRIPEAVL